MAQLQNSELNLQAMDITEIAHKVCHSRYLCICQTIAWEWTSPFWLDKYHHPVDGSL